MLDIEEPSFDGLLQEIQGGLEKVQECVSKLQKYADKDSSCARFASPARHRKGSKESLCGEERPERPQLLRKSVSFLPNEMEAPVAGERKSDTQSGTSSNQLSKGDSQDYVSIAKTLGLGIGLLSRQISQAFVPRETWIEDLGGDEDVFQDILEDLAEKYAQKPDTQSRPVLPPSASECEEQKSSHCGCARCCRLRLMMHPQSRRRLIWDSVSVFMISVDMIMLPMIYGMDISEVLEVLVVEWICTIFWSVDMIITFMTGYTMGPDVIMNPRKVAIHYLTTWFAVDFAIVGSEWASRITEFVAGFNAFRAARAVRVLRVVRVVRLIRLARFVKTLQKFTEMTGSLRLLILFNVMKLTLFLLLAVHVFSCGWHFVGLYTDGGWIAKEGYVGESVIVRYVAAVRWTLSQLNGRTDRQDRTFTEMLYVAFTACFTLIFMSIFVSSLTSRMLQLQQLMDRESGYKRLLQRYNEMHNLSFTTVYLAKRHIRDRMTLESDMDTEKLLRLLPVQTQVGNLFSSDLARRAPPAPPAPSAPSTEEAPGTLEAPPIPEEYLSETTVRFGECLDNLVEVLWSFHLRLQLVHAVFLGDVFRLAHWSLRLLGLSQPWPLRRLHDFALSSLELLLEQGEDQEDSRAAANTWLTESCSFYLGVPVIPRMQPRMRNCLHALRRGNWLSSSLLDELLNLETDSSDFDATGSNLRSFRAEDPIHSSFQRLIREAVIGRVDRSCHLDCRQQGLKAQCLAPLNCSAWTKSRRCQLLLEVLNSVPQEPRQRVLQLLDEETPEERAMQSEIQRQLSNRNPESNFAFCSSVCSGKPGPD